MTPIGFEKISSVLCLGAHPDDIEIGCGGTILKLLAANPNVKVHWHVFSGSATRTQEAISGANLFLAKATKSQVTTSQFPDSFFPAHWQAIKDSFADLKSLDPELIFTHRLEDRHQDHRVISELTWNGFRDHCILEYEIPKFEGDLASPNIYVGFDESICETKIGYLIDAHQTQAEKPWFRPDVFRSLMCLRSIESGTGCDFAEGFYCRKLNLSFA